MDRTNGASFRALEHMYQGKSGGVDKNTNDDVLTRKIVTMGKEPVAIFERVGNKSVWQKVRNAANGTQRATADDVKTFLTSRGISAKNAEAMVKNITMRSGAISARGFEQLLQTEGKATEAESALYKPTQF